MLRLTAAVPSGGSPLAVGVAITLRGLGATLLAEIGRRRERIIAYGCYRHDFLQLNNLPIQ
jgi:hypothetical protein